MADVSVARGEIGSPIVTLTANAVSTVTFAEDLKSVEVISDGASPVWWTMDGTTPAAGAGYYIPLAGVDQRGVSHGALDSRATDTVIKLWSTGTPTIRVQCGDS